MLRKNHNHIIIITRKKQSREENSLRCTKKIIVSLKIAPLPSLIEETRTMQYIFTEKEKKKIVYLRETIWNEYKMGSA